jgi:hypothetical protein
MTEDAADTDLPQLVKDEFGAFLYAASWPKSVLLN